MLRRRKRFLAIDRALDRRVHAAACDEGLSASAWIEQCIEDRLIVEDGLRAMADYERQFGCLPEDARRQASVEIDEAMVAARLAHDEHRATGLSGSA